MNGGRREDGDRFAQSAIEPLSVMVRREVAKPEDVTLARTLHQVLSAADPSPDAAFADTEAGYAAIEGKVRRMAAARRRRRALREIWMGLGAWRLLVGASALVMVVGLAAWKFWPSLMMSTSSSGARPSLLVESRARVKSVGRDFLRVTLASGASLELRGTIDVDQSDTNRVSVRLLDGKGEILVSVPHLHPGASLVVSGAHADAIVHGTRFRVEDLGSGGTSVQVFEGMVEVVPRGGDRPSMFLAAGSSLLVPTLKSHLRDLAERVETAAEPADCRAVENMAAVALGTASDIGDPSAALYLRAACAARAGDRVSAIRDFEKAARVSQDPTRADNALARAAELRQALDPVAGRAAWHAYLARFPNGLHRQMAQDSLSSLSRTVR